MSSPVCRRNEEVLITAIIWWAGDHKAGIISFLLTLSFFVHRAFLCVVKIHVIFLLQIAILKFSFGSSVATEDVDFVVNQIRDDVKVPGKRQ